MFSAMSCGRSYRRRLILRLWRFDAIPFRNLQIASFLSFLMPRFRYSAVLVVGELFPLCSSLLVVLTTCGCFLQHAAVGLTLSRSAALDLLRLPYCSGDFLRSGWKT